MIKGIRHFGIVVEDLQLSLAFYRDLLDFEIMVTADEDSTFINKILALDSSKLTTCKLKGPDGNIIELLDFGKDQISRENNITATGPTHLAFTVDNAEEIFNRLTSKGIKFISAPEISPNGEAKVSFCQAPEGTYIELVELLDV